MGYRLPMSRTPFSWERSEARAGKFDGAFLIGVLTTGIYCLPSCPARPPKAENVRLFDGEAPAQAAGLRACKRCRPDLYYRGESGDLQLFEGLVMRLRAAPQDFADATALAAAAGVSQTKLNALFRDHAHLAPVAFLRRERVRAAAQALLETNARVVDIGLASGFESESVLHRQFVAHQRMTPGAYRALRNATAFLLQLPPGYRAAEVLAYHARDPQSRCERVDGHRIFKALALPEGPCVLEIAIAGAGAAVTVHPAGPRSAESMAFLHAAALRMLGLAGDVTGCARRISRNPRLARVFAARAGLRLPLIPTGFDALCWAIIGQQINVPFAAALRREIIDLAGEAVGEMRTHPSPARLADLGATALTQRRYARSKADYLIGAAEAAASGALEVERLAEGSAVAAEKRLMAQRGIGVWTARYQMLRTGFADAAPVGDCALATALQRLNGLEERPGQDEVERLMQDFAPYRALATAHLWASLKKDAA